MKKNLVKFAVIGAAAAVLPVIGAGQAFADYAPQPNDIVGVGGDTPQFAVDNLINGDTVGHLGFDNAAGVNRVDYFDASGDANGRQTYTNNVTTGVELDAAQPHRRAASRGQPRAAATEQRSGSGRAGSGSGKCGLG